MKIKPKNNGSWKNFKVHLAEVNFKVKYNETKQVKEL